MTLRQAAREPAFYFLTIAGMFWWFGRAGLVLHVLPYFTDSGISDAVAVLALSVQALTGAGGIMVGGFLRDRFGVRYVLAADLVINAIAVTLLLMVGAGWAALLWSVLYGTAQGASVPLQRLMYADYFGRRNLGSIEGVVRAIQNVTQALGPLVAAFAYDVTQGYTLIFSVFIVTNLAAAALVFSARQPKDTAGGSNGGR